MKPIIEYNGNDEVPILHISFCKTRARQVVYKTIYLDNGNTLLNLNRKGLVCSMTFFLPHDMSDEAKAALKTIQ